MARTATQNSTEASAPQRPRRTHVDKRNRLVVRNPEDGFHYRIVNDVDDRIEQFQLDGWEICPNAKVGAVGDRRVDNPSSLGSTPSVSVGKGVKATVMRIQKEWYEQDQKSKMAELDALEETMRQDAKKKADYGNVDFSR